MGRGVGQGTMIDRRSRRLKHQPFVSRLHGDSTAVSERLLCARSLSLLRLEETPR